MITLYWKHLESNAMAGKSIYFELWCEHIYFILVAICHVECAISFDYLHIAWAPPNSYKVHIISILVAWNDTSNFVIICHIISYFEKFRTIFLKLLLCLIHFITDIDIIYTFNTFESIQTQWEQTDRSWDRIQYEFFIKCTVASLIFCMIQ